MDEYKPLVNGSGKSTIVRLVACGRGLHSFPIQLNLSSSVHRVTQLNP